MLETYPQQINLDLGKFAATIGALVACSEACTECADACLSEGMVAELTKCIRTNMDWRGHLRYYDPGVATYRLRRHHQQHAAGCLRHGVQIVWGRVRPPRPRARALPYLRGRLPGLRTGMPGPPGHHGLRDRLIGVSVTPGPSRIAG